MIVGITLAGSALAADDPLLKAIKARQGEMQLRAFNAGPLFAMAKGDIDYDADLDNSRAWARGSDNEAYPGKTTSPPKIWTTYPEIGEYGQKYAMAVNELAAAAGNGRQRGGVRRARAAVRLRALPPSPASLWHYLRRIGRREPSGTAGHNPVGSLSVMLMLVSIAAQATTGLFIVSDEFFESGPPASYVSGATVNRMTWGHHLNADIILVLVVLHLGAIAFYLLWRRENLVKPMITGWKWVKRDGDR